MINPIAFQLGPLKVHWYGISYGVALMTGIFVLTRLNKIRPVFKTTDQIYDLAFWVFMLGVIVGGRLGYVLFYNLPYYLANPAKIIAVWDGGMSFHGGLIVCLMVGVWFCRKHKINFFDLADLAVIPGALALFFTRLANFVNRELVGRAIENHRWDFLGIDFGDGILRFPSQLFQAADSLILFLILILILILKKPRQGVLFWSYIALYGLFRSVIEFWRAPDPQVGYLLTYFTLGQLLSFGMFLIGLVGLLLIKKHRA